MANGEKRTTIELPNLIQRTIVAVQCSFDKCFIVRIEMFSKLECCGAMLFKLSSRVLLRYVKVEKYQLRYQNEADIS